MIADPFRATFAATRLVLAVAAVVFGLSVWSPPAGAQKESGTVDFVELSGVIDPVSSRFLLRRIDLANEAGVNAIVVRLDTPGGLDISMREIVQKILSSRVPVVVWVAPGGARAASAGVFITYAAHVAVMTPGTNIGAAHPVDLGGGLDEVSDKKATNDAAAYLRSIARVRGRNEAWAEEAVRNSASVSADEALSMEIVDLVAGANDLYQKLDGRTVDTPQGPVILKTANVQIRFHKMSLVERILHSTIRPEIAYMLLILGFYGLIFELYNPGIGAAGVLGGVSLILGFYALSVLPTSWAGVALITLGVAFFLVDLHTAGLGVFTVGGTVAGLAGSLLLFAGADPEFRLGWWVIAAVLTSNFLFFLLVMTAAIRSRLAKPASGAEGMIGTTGVARSDIAPEGRVHARGTLWRARTAGAAIPEGAEVRILGVSGLLLIVEEGQQAQRN